jgi:carbonic anhydrase
MLSGLIGGLPITQVIVRSSTNINSGGKTKLSAIIHGVILLLSAALIPSYLNYIPLASLACILLLIGYKLARVELFKKMYTLGADQFIPFVVTIIAILLTDLLLGIGIGMAIAIYFILRKNYKHSYRYKTESFGDTETIRLILSEEVTFLNKGSIQLTLDQLPENCMAVVDGSKSVNIDYDVCELIYDFKNHTAPMRNIQLVLIDIPELEKRSV